jgi:hypothetical protein
MTRPTQVVIGVGILLLVGAGYLLFVYRQRAVEKSTIPAICTAPPETAATGNVTYPIAEQYHDVPGLGVFLTAADCGEWRFADVEKRVQYGLVGGKLFFRNVPTQAARDALVSLGFECLDPDIECTSWRVGETIPASKDLLKLKPFVGEIRREECGQCG